MAIELNNVSSGYSTGVINDNFQRVEDELNGNVLRRNGLSPGEANQMNVPLDMNSNLILNALTDVDNPGSLITVGDADIRYVNATGDSMQGSLNMESYPIFVRIAVNGNEPSRKDQLDAERSQRLSGDVGLSNKIDQDIATERNIRIAEDNSIRTNYQAADANIQAQLTGEVPLEASAFSPISWHDQVIESSVTIPENKNAWSFGPTVTIAAGQSVTVGAGSFWTIANGEVV